MVGGVCSPLVFLLGSVPQCLLSHYLSLGLFTTHDSSASKRGFQEGITQNRRDTNLILLHDYSIFHVTCSLALRHCTWECYQCGGQKRIPYGKRTTIDLNQALSKRLVVVFVSHISWISETSTCRSSNRTEDPKHGGLPRNGETLVMRRFPRINTRTALRKIACQELILRLPWNMT